MYEVFVLNGPGNTYPEQEAIKQYKEWLQGDNQRRGAEFKADARHGGMSSWIAFSAITKIRQL